MALFFVLGLSPMAESQFFGVCNRGDVGELNESLKAHQEHVLRLSTKFDDIWYFQGKLPPSFRPAPGLDSVHRFLGQLVAEGRRPGVVFYAYSSDHGSPPAADADGAVRLCSWLMTPSAPTGRVYSHVARLNMSTLKSLQPRLRQALGTMEAAASAGPVDLDSVVLELSELLLPTPISEGILRDGIDTLIVVPVTIAIPKDDGSRRRTTELVAAVGTVPFSLLRLGPGRDKRLLDVASVVIAPGFAALAERRIAPRLPLERPLPPDSVEPPRSRAATLTDTADAIVVGDPTNPSFRRLREAGQEAEEVAASVGTHALVGQAATKELVVRRLRAGQDRAGLIYLATHGVANQEDHPLDRSFLVMSDGLLTAREISTLRFVKRPLVVMSACESGLGRDFEVGTIGLARAWQQAGASKVVMSLWRVDDSATRRLMTDFIRLLKHQPPDIALREAMSRFRDRTGDAGLWSGFALFGVP